MRIATWNLNRPTKNGPKKNSERRKKVYELNADIWILTETHTSIDLSPEYRGEATRPSPRKDLPGESCATIWSRWPIVRRIKTVDETESVCVEIAGPDQELRLLVYGCIIPWKNYRGRDGSSKPWEENWKFIELYGRDWSRLVSEFPTHTLIVGGDFNQDRDGSRWYGQEPGYTLLSKAMQAAGLVCVTEEDFVKVGKLKERHSVDHICVSRNLSDPVQCL